MPDIATEESILNSMKKLLNMPSDYDAFDTDIKLHINTYISVLRGLGIGKPNVRVIDATTTWTDLLGTFEERAAATGDNTVDLADVPSWMYTKLKLIFDPPVNSFVVSGLQELAKEMEFHFFMVGEHMRLKAPTFWGDIVTNDGGITHE